MFLGFDFSAWQRRRQPVALPVHQHQVPIIKADGTVGFRVGTCVEVDQLRNAAHVHYTVVPDGVGGSKRIASLLGCHEAENQRLGLLAENTRLIGKIQDQDREIARLQAEVAQDKRLMGASLPIVFGMRDVLDKLSQDNLASPDLTEDKTAVKLVCALYTVVIVPFHEDGKQLVHLRSNVAGVPDRPFVLVNGTLSEDQQTLFIGHVARIRAAAEDNGSDPVTGTVDLVGTKSTN